MEKTLYFCERQGMRVTRDGPSLWIEQPGRAGCRVPGRLIRQAVIVGNVALDAGSLLLLAERGIPVMFLRRDGTPAAALWGVSGVHRQRSGRQRALTGDPSGQDRVLAWLHAWRRGRQLALVRRLDPETAAQWKQRGYRNSDYARWLAARAEATAAPSRPPAFFRGALAELIAVEIAARDWDPHFGVEHKGEPLGLVKDFTDALEPDVHGLWIEPHHESETARAESPWAEPAAVFERVRPRIAALIRLMMDQYADLLWES
ncbi:MAG: CRISPR-associated endonuclease Cas1 [Nitrospirae bacterium]|nr:CRISPR-associated endonuclease Cas1 [Nitrospirota bacterium]